MNRRIGTMPSFARPPKDATCVERIQRNDEVVFCASPAVRMLVSVKSTVFPPVASPACASCSEVAISARRARLAGDGEAYRLATESAHGWPPKAPATPEKPGNSAPVRAMTGPKASGGQKDRSGAQKKAR